MVIPEDIVPPSRFAHLQQGSRSFPNSAVRSNSNSAAKNSSSKSPGGHVTVKDVLVNMTALLKKTDDWTDK